MSFAWGAIADAAASNVNNIASLLEQRRENKKDRQFQSEQNELDRAWQSEMQREEFERQSAWQEKMWNAQNEYNSPLAQINRLQAAGINPVASLYGGSAGSAAGNSQNLPTAPNPSAPSGHSVSGGHGVSAFHDTPALFSSIAQLREASSRTDKNKAEADRIRSLTEPEVEGAKAAAERDRSAAAASQEQSALTAIHRSLAEKFGDDKSVAEINKLVSESYENYAKGNYDKAQTELTRVTESIARLDWSYKSEALPTLLTNLKLLGDVYRSEASRNIAQAELSRSEVDVNDEVRQLTYYKRLIEKNNWNIKDSTFLEELQAVRDSLKKKGVELGISEQEWNRITTENKWVNPDHVIEFLNRSLDALLKVKAFQQ